MLRARLREIRSCLTFNRRCCVTATRIFPTPSEHFSRLFVRSYGGFEGSSSSVGGIFISNNLSFDSPKRAPADNFLHRWRQLNEGPLDHIGGQYADSYLVAFSSFWVGWIIYNDAMWSHGDGDFWASHFYHRRGRLVYSRWLVKVFHFLFLWRFRLRDLEGIPNLAGPTEMKRVIASSYGV